YSPLFFVFSYLDGRCLKGLYGRYSLRLHFEPYYDGRPNAEGYIVRYHGNYLMQQVVSMELIDLLASNYAINLKVTGEQDSDAQSVEQVVKHESAQSVEEEKLDQAGYGYELAHIKA
ncbi:hypothetical protein BFJ63_vAg20262, partial [Fusarium oxysporum f. sp. narcissi]